MAKTELATFSYLHPFVLPSFAVSPSLAFLGIHNSLDLNLGWLWRLGFLSMASALGGGNGW